MPMCSKMQLFVEVPFDPLSAAGLDSVSSSARHRVNYIKAARAAADGPTKLQGNAGCCADVPEHGSMRSRTFQKDVALAVVGSSRARTNDKAGLVIMSGGKEDRA